MPSSGGQTCALDRKSTRLNSSHTIISYAVFCLKKKNCRLMHPTRVTSGADRSSAARRRRWRARGPVPRAHPAALVDREHPVLLFLFFLKHPPPPESPLFPHNPPFPS